MRKTRIHIAREYNLSRQRYVYVAYVYLSEYQKLMVNAVSPNRARRILRANLRHNRAHWERQIAKLKGEQ